ncbi:MAG: F0F1 ATP synthase subunit delta, partial [Deltaproteobacteria bacterium]|nr:F0F1 ATP synthase subunit delta [Deltaproteobacteria bacterium]
DGEVAAVAAAFADIAESGTGAVTAKVTTAVALSDSAREELTKKLAKMAGKDVELTVRLSPALPRRFRGDAGRLRQVLGNLLGNAIKFTAHGSIHLDAAAGNLRNDGRMEVRIRIEDSGVGISPEAQALLFRPFAQADSSTARRFGGTGLGLAICKSLVEAMGGQIGVTSQEGAGSTFEAAVFFQPELNAPRVTVPHAAKLRSLVVVPNARLRGVLREQLSDWGFAVAEAGDLRLEGELPEVVLCDESAWAAGGGPQSRASQTKVVVLRPVVASATDLNAPLPGATAIVRLPPRPSQLAHTLEQALAGGGGEARRSVPVASGALAGGAQARVLLVEDNPVNQMIASKMLQKLGVTVSVAGDGREAIDITAREQFDLVLMDCQMPEVDGFEATAAIRAREAQQGVAAGRIPIVALTASALPGDREKTLAAGMDDHVSKPVTSTALRNAIERWVRRASGG